MIHKPGSMKIIRVNASNALGSFYFLAKDFRHVIWAAEEMGLEGVYLKRIQRTNWQERDRYKQGMSACAYDTFKGFADDDPRRVLYLGRGERRGHLPQIRNPVHVGQ